MQLVCGVALFNSGDQRSVIPISFQLPSTAYMMSCKKVAISVQSIRWPVSRYTSTRFDSALPRPIKHFFLNLS